MGLSMGLGMEELEDLTRLLKRREKALRSVEVKVD